MHMYKFFFSQVEQSASEENEYSESRKGEGGTVLFISSSDTFNDIMERHTKLDPPPLT